MPTGLSAECASVDARAGWVHLASRRVTRARTHLGDQAHSQHRVDRSTQEVRVQGITDHSARMPTLRNACSVCAISAAKASWLSLRRSSWVLDTVPPTHPLSDMWSEGVQCSHERLRSTPRRPPPSRSVHVIARPEQSVPCPFLLAASLDMHLCPGPPACAMCDPGIVYATVEDADTHAAAAACPGRSVPSVARLARCCVCVSCIAPPGNPLDATPTHPPTPHSTTLPVCDVRSGNAWWLGGKHHSACGRMPLSVGACPCPSEQLASVLWGAAWQHLRCPTTTTTNPPHPLTLHSTTCARLLTHWTDDGHCRLERTHIQAPEQPWLAQSEVGIAQGQDSERNDS